MCGHTRDPIIYSEFHRNPFRGFGAPGVKIWPFPLLWLVAFTTACTTVQAVIDHYYSQQFYETMKISRAQSYKSVFQMTVQYVEQFFTALQMVNILKRHIWSSVSSDSRNAVCKCMSLRRPITASTVVQAVVIATCQSNGKGQILTPWGPETLERISMKLGIYNRAAGMTTHANPCGAATTWVVWANT